MNISSLYNTIDHMMRSYKIPKSKIFSNHINYDDIYYMTDRSRYIMTQLNSAKNLLDEIYTDNIYKQISQALDHCRNLRRIITDRYGGQNVTNSWLKMYELLVYHRLLDSSSRYYFANCEMPGSFIMAFNHYNKTMLHNRVEWYASSILCNSNDDSYLGDRYLLYKTHNDKWLMSNNNGDITNIYNINSIRNNLLEKTRGNLVDLYTSDGGTDVSSDYNNQEHLEAILNLGQVITGLVTLAANGNLVVKTFTYFEPYSISLIMLLSSMFEEFYISKPMSSRQTNSEVYLVGKHYNGCPDYIMRLLATRLTSFSMKPFIIERYLHSDNNFMQAIYASHNIFIEQSEMLRSNYDLYIRYRNNLNDITKMTKHSRSTTIKKYLTTYPIVTLSKCDMINCNNIF